jgi:hypothetical protein
MKHHENHDQHEGQHVEVARHGPENATKPDGPGPYWKRAHHDWRFWVAVILMFAAISIYVLSGDLALRPRGQNRQPQQPILAP